MTLGLTSTGAIKIKTDSPLGLRAVECACCGGCGCVSVAGVLINGVPLSDVLDAATTGTANGIAPFYWDNFSEGWHAEWMSTFIQYNSVDKTLCGNWDNAFDAATFGSPSSCCPDGLTCNEIVATVNGHPFAALQFNYGSGSDLSISLNFS